MKLLPFWRLRYLPYLLLFVIIFISDDTITFGTSAEDLFPAKFTIYIFLLARLSMLSGDFIGYSGASKEKAAYLSNKDGVRHCFVAIVFSIIFSSVVNLDFRGGYIYQLTIVALSFMIVRYIPFDDYVKIFNKIMVYICCISLLIEFIYGFFPWVFESVATVENLAGTELINIFVSGIFINSNILRNTAIFREPGVFMIYISLGIIFETFRIREPQLKYILLFYVTLFSTYSTAGVIIGTVLVFITLAQAPVRKIQYLKVTLFGLLFITGLYTFLTDSISFSLFDKFNTDSESYISSLGRQASISISLDIFLNSPIFGSGLTSFASLFEVYALKSHGFHFSSGGFSSNSFASLFATYGFIYGFLVLASFYGLTAHFAKSRYIQAALFFTFLLLFSNEDLRYSLFFYTLVFFGISGYKTVGTAGANGKLLVVSEHHGP